jgi:FkbH-like protein
VNAFDRAMQAETLHVLKDALLPKRPSLSLLQIGQLTKKLLTLSPERQPLRAAVLRTYTSELLRPHWAFEAALNGLDLKLYEGPYGAVVQEAQPTSSLVAHDPEITYLLLRWEDLEPGLGQPLMGLPAERRREVLDGAVASLLSMLGQLRQAVHGLIVVTLLPRMHSGELGMFESMASEGDDALLARTKQDIAAAIQRDYTSTFFLDLDQVAQQIGRANLFDPRMWFSSRFPFSETGAAAVVKQLVKCAVVLKTPKAKVIVLDCDNTLWGGIIGEDGMTGIALGPDYPGSVFVAFQRRLLDLQQRGFLLALCSKNDHEAVLEVLRTHPHQVIREEHLAAMQVNWNPKSENLRALAQELNLGMDSFIFVDDSPHECLIVRQQCEGVSVVQVPERLHELPWVLDDVARLEILSLTTEDRQRTEMYTQERQRKALAGSAQNLDEYLRSLQMAMQIGVDDPRSITRIAQLTGKTNQFNVTTKRYTEDDIRSFMADSASHVAHFSLRDVFGDSGIVGVAIIRGATGRQAEIDSFLMSCRVIGRSAEAVFLGHLLQRLRERGVESVRAAYVPTAKNRMVQHFWRDQGFTEVNPGTFELDLTTWTMREDLPIAVTMSGGTQDLTLATASQDTTGSR